MGTNELKLKLQRSLREITERRKEILYCISVDNGSQHLTRAVVALNDLEKIFSSLLFTCNRITKDYVYNKLKSFIRCYSYQIYKYRLDSAENRKRANYINAYNLEIVNNCTRMLKDYEQ